MRNPWTLRSHQKAPVFGHFERLCVYSMCTPVSTNGNTRLVDRPIIAARREVLSLYQQVKSRHKIGPVNEIFNRPIALILRKLCLKKAIGRLRYRQVKRQNAIRLSTTRVALSAGSIHAQPERRCEFGPKTTCFLGLPKQSCLSMFHFLVVDRLCRAHHIEPMFALVSRLAARRN